MNTSIILKLSISSKKKHLFLRTILLITSAAIVLQSCSNDGNNITTPQEQLSFTAQDTTDISTLAKTIFPGEIESIVISTVRSMSGIMTRSAVAMPPSNYARVTFEPEYINLKLKRYRSLYLSNITWLESKSLLSNKSRITRNNWITSSDNLSSIDKTILLLDSCTIEAVVTDANVDTVEHMLNLISASCYSSDSIPAYLGTIDLREVTLVRWRPDFESYNVEVICSGYKYYCIHYHDGKVKIVNVSIRVF